MKKVPPSERKRQQLEELICGVAGGIEDGSILSRFMKLATEKLLQELLEREQEEFLGRERYSRERKEEEGQSGIYRNGYETGRLKTAEGVLEVCKPQIRGLDEAYRSQVWERLGRTSEQLKDLVIEMYVRGMSTRDVESALEQALGGFVLSKSSVSTISEELLEEYERFRVRDLSGYDVAYLFIDTVYEPLRRYGASSGVMCCWAYLTDGSKALISLSLANKESETACLDFLRDLVTRGLRTPLTVTTDGAAGLIRAVDQLWPKSLRIRCWAHKMRNLEAKVPGPIWQEFKQLLWEVRDASSPEQAQAQVDSLVKQYEKQLPEACRCLLDDCEASLQHLRLPRRHRQYVRTTNLIERTFVEQRRRSKVIPHFWDQKDLIKLVFGTLVRVGYRWEQAQFSQFEREQIRQLRVLILDRTDAIAEEKVTRRRSAHRVA